MQSNTTPSRIHNFRGISHANRTTQLSPITVASKTRPRLRGPRLCPEFNMLFLFVVCCLSVICRHSFFLIRYVYLPTKKVDHQNARSKQKQLTERKKWIHLYGYFLVRMKIYMYIWRKKGKAHVFAKREFLILSWVKAYNTPTTVLQFFQPLHTVPAFVNGSQEV